MKMSILKKLNLSERNKKVALARWNKICTKQKEKIPNDAQSLLLKSAICGFLTGDGSVQKRKEKHFYHYQIDFFPDDKVMMETYINQIKIIYDKVPTIRKNKKFYSVRFTSKVAVEDISNLAKFGLKRWTLPKSLFKIEGAKENWLRAFFSAEAYVGRKRIKIQTVNKKGMKEISKILKNMGIANNYYEYNSKKASDSLVSIIFITKKESMLKFYNLIGFWHSKKTKALKESLGL